VPPVEQGEEPSLVAATGPCSTRTQPAVTAQEERLPGLNAATLADACRARHEEATVLQLGAGGTRIRSSSDFLTLPFRGNSPARRRCHLPPAASTGRVVELTARDHGCLAAGRGQQTGGTSSKDDRQRAQMLEDVGQRGNDSPGHQSQPAVFPPDEVKQATAGLPGHDELYANQGVSGTAVWFVFVVVLACARVAAGRR